MPDVHDRATRSRNMSAIAGKNTKPEMTIRKALHAAGLRYRLHGKDLPGRPDLIFPKHHAVLFVHGCFWHGHDCALFRWPASRQEFWENKIRSNQVRDARNLEDLAHRGWRTGIVWECALKGKDRLDLPHIIEDIRKWLLSDAPTLTIRGRPTGTSESEME